VARREPDEFLDAFSALARAIRGAAAQSYASFEVGSTQAKFLRQIGKTRGISQAELARATVTDPTLTGRVLETLVERGWVRRKRSSEDRRQYVLELSAAGARMRKRVEGARAHIAARMVTKLDARDWDDFERIAARLHAALTASTT
jgi:DNA-binding MarR family transcriptional regulator